MNFFYVQSRLQSCNGIYGCYAGMCTIETAMSKYLRVYHNCPRHIIRWAYKCVTLLNDLDASSEQIKYAIEFMLWFVQEYGHYVELGQEDQGDSDNVRKGVATQIKTVEPQKPMSHTHTISQTYPKSAPAKSTDGAPLLLVLVFLCTCVITFLIYFLLDHWYSRMGFVIRLSGIITVRK